MKIKNKNRLILKQVFQVFLLAALVACFAGILRMVETILTKKETLAKQPTESVTMIIQSGYIGYGYCQPLPVNQKKIASQKTEPQVLGLAFDKAGETAENIVWQAEKVDQLSPTIKMTAGKSLTFWVDFKNTGTATWFNSGKNFVALNVTGPSGRHSLFQHVFWPKYYRPCKMLTQTVKPGETARFKFALKVSNQPGEYTEKFQLVAENLIWIPGGEWEIPITVLEPPPVWQAELVSTSFSEIQVIPGSALTFEASFKNTGSANWSNNDKHFIALNVSGPSARQSPFLHEYWPQYYRPCKMLTQTVKTGETGQFRFAMQVPDQTGFYLEEFNLVAENLIWIPGGHLSIPITVKQPTVPANTSPTEQNIRVGLFNSDEPIQITANKEFTIIDSENNTLAELAGGEIVTTIYQEGVYKITGLSSEITSTLPVIFAPVKSETIFEIISFQNATAWNSGINDNRYRGQLEINHASSTNGTWVINELPLELYLRGVAEAGNEDLAEYLKALIIAERTYAQYHLNTGTKHAAENFTVDAVNDQVYRGYGFEERAYNIVNLVEETKGVMVTYNGEIVVTPYFSHTDGRTRAWEEVWSGDPKPWLISVPDPACQGMELLGHGVGLSGYGARKMAEEGSTYDQILKYYYTGINIQDYY